MRCFLRLRLASALVGLAMVAGCASTVPPTDLAATEGEQEVDPSPVATAAPIQPTANPSVEPTLIPASPPAPAARSPEPAQFEPPKPEATAVPEDQPEVEPEPMCVPIADFVSDEASSRWLVVNDNVMGGRSLGDRTFADQTMIFEGSINTNGGGFSSIRLPLESGALVGVDRLVLRARADSRTYLLTFQDSLEGRDRRVSFRAPIEFATPGEWETVTVKLADLFAAVFGQRVATDPFREDLATRIGIMQSDGVDGEFRLEIERIDACLAES